MENTSIEVIDDLIIKQRAFFATGKTKEIQFRLSMLKRLKQTIMTHENDISDAIGIDLHKSEEECFLTETSIVLQEIDIHINNIKRWAKPKRKSSPITIFPSSSKIISEPLGVALIIAPWNYPFHLLFNPLVGAISAGCCAILKPSPYTPTIAKLMERMIS